MSGPCLAHSAKIWSQTKRPSTDEWTKKMWPIRTTEYYSTFKKKEKLPLAATWMALEDVTLREIRQSEKDKYFMNLLHRAPKIVKGTETDNRMMVAKGLGRGSGELFNGHKVSVMVDDGVLEICHTS